MAPAKNAKLRLALFCWTLLIDKIHCVGVNCDKYGGVEDDEWRLCNMFGTVTYLQEHHGWFSSSSNDPCDWDNRYGLSTGTIGCGNTGEVTRLSISNAGNLSGYSINTTYWPSKLEHIDFTGNFLSGILYTDTMPNTIEKLSFWDNYFYNDIFPDFSHLTKLHCIDLDHGATWGPNPQFLLSKLPPNLECIYLQGNDIRGHLDFSESSLPSLLKFMAYDIDSIDGNYTNSSFEFEDTNFDSVNFYGLAPNATVYLRSEAVCESFSYCCSNCFVTNERSDYACDGETDCINTCGACVYDNNNNSLCHNESHIANIAACAPTVDIDGGNGQAGFVEELIQFFNETEFVYFIMAGISVFLLLSTFFILLHMKKKLVIPSLGCKKADDIGWERVWLFGLQVWDLITDIYFSYKLVLLCVKQNGSNYVILVISVLSPLFILVPYCLNINCAINKLYINIKTNNTAKLYFDAKFPFFIALVLISGGIQPSIQLLSCKIFGLALFDCGLNKYQLSLFRKLHLKYTVLLENMPQLVIQTIYIIEMQGQVDEIVFWAIVASFFNALVAIIGYFFSKQLHLNQVLICLDVCFDQSSIDSDFEQFNTFYGLKRTLGKEIARTLGVISPKIELFSIIATNDGCCVNFGYSMKISNGNQRAAEIASAFSNSTVSVSGSARSASSPRNSNETVQMVMDIIHLACQNESLIPKSLMQTWKLTNLPTVTVNKDEIFLISGNSEISKFTVAPAVPENQLQQDDASPAVDSEAIETDAEVQIEYAA